MKWSKLIAMLMLMSVAIIVSGCNWYRKEIDLKPGQSARLYKTIRIQLIVRNKQTGEMEKRIYQTKNGDRIYCEKINLDK